MQASGDAAAEPPKQRGNIVKLVRDDGLDRLAVEPRWSPAFPRIVEQDQHLPALPRATPLRKALPNSFPCKGPADAFVRFACRHDCLQPFSRAAADRSKGPGEDRPRPQEDATDRWAQ